MDNAAITKLVNSIKHQAGREFVISILRAMKDEIILAHHAVNIQSVKSPKKRSQTILEEVVECIVAQNPHKKKFGLCISERAIKQELFTPFCKVLENFKYLSTLSLVRCQFTDIECLAALGVMLSKNTCITSLNLSQSSIPDEGIEPLANGIKNNTTLVDLFLDNIRLSNVGASAFANIVLTSTKQKIKTIDLSYNQIGSDGYEVIRSCCEKNLNNTDIRLKGNTNITRDKLAEFETLLARNACVSHALNTILENAITTINVAIRVRQTTAMMSSRAPVDMPGSRSRRRGGTIDESTAPVHVLTASSANEIMEDCGDSPSVRYKVGAAHTRGRRKDMQDATLLQGCFNGNENEDFFCVFDGHGTQEPAIYAAKNLPDLIKENLLEGKNELDSLCDSFITINQRMEPFAVRCGTTAVVCLIRDHILYTANVGDSRAVLCRGGKAIRLTVDHKPNLQGETERVEHMGGAIKNNRVEGQLAVTRALGDWFAGLLVSPEPYVTKTHLNKDDEFLLIACDGLFDVFSDDVAVEKIKGMEDPTEAALKLKDEAFTAGSMDNISVVVVRLGTNHPFDPVPEHDPVILKGLWVPEFSDDGSSSAVEVESESDEEEEQSAEENGKVEREEKSPLAGAPESEPQNGPTEDLNRKISLDSSNDG